MRRRAVGITMRVGIVVFWLAMLGWLLRYEAFPEYFTRQIDGYKSLLSKDTLVTDAWMRILIKGQPIGYTHSSMDINEANTVHHYELQNRVYMKLNVMGTVQNVHASAEVLLDALHKLQKFTFAFSAQGNLTRVSGIRGHGDMFDVTIKTGGVASQQKVEIPDDVVIHSPQTEFAVKQLKPGQQLGLRTLDPTTLKTTRIVIKALRHESIEVNGQPHETTLLATEAWGRESFSWINTEGTIVRQKTPFGWIFEACSPEEAYAAYKGSEGAEDILGEMAVSCTGTITDPRERSRLVLDLEGVPARDLVFPSARHTAETLAPSRVRLTVSSQPRPRNALTETELPASFAPFLKATTFIQSDHPDIRTRSQAITRNLATPIEKARAIFRWVDKQVIDEPNASLPSALSVLKSMRGDCNEHTYLFVALARAAGLPAKIMVGLAYHEHAFYYHAWPAVYVGDWIEMDPTWGQELVDATHLALVEGELESQYQLVKVMGQLSITVVEQE